MFPTKLIEPHDPLIHTKLEPFDFDSDVDPVELKKHMFDIMFKNNGIGLSANQIGLPYRVFVMRAGDEGVACFNPEITYYSDKVVPMKEGCLTYPKLFVTIKRSEVIRAKYTDEHGELHTQKFIGLTARVFQHEFDHMEGVDYLSRASRIQLNRAKNQYRLLQRKLKKHPEKKKVIHV